jgi:serine/threonine protein kinase
MPPLDPDPRTVDDDAPTRERSTATTLPDPERAGAHTGIASAFAYLSLRARFFPQEPQTRLTVAGRYTLLEKLGEGAMGVVFAAFDAKLGRKVALKVVRSYGDADARARLLREAQSLAQLSDPNVVQVHEVDEYRGEVYVAMELVEGVSLGAWITASAPRFAALFDVLLAAGRGLAAAHGRGVIHRDIKPANILVGADGRARVADFGLAWLDVEGTGAAADPSGSMVSTLPSVRSQSGAGTPAYMSPEQLRQEPLDARSDLFGFCVVVWETVFGAHPFPAASVEQVALKICDGQITPPPSRPRGVPSRLEKILR